MEKKYLKLRQSIAKKTKALRKEKNFTQEKMAEKLNVSLRYYQKLETDQNLSIESLAKIAIALKVPIKDLLDVESVEG